MRHTSIPRVFMEKWEFRPELQDINYGYSKVQWKPWGDPCETIGLHCFTEDWRFENVWRRPEMSLKFALDSPVVIGPDFSVYKSPMEIIEWQLYRASQVNGYWQENGVNVIPAITWLSRKQILFHEKYYTHKPIIAVRCPTKAYEDIWIECANLIKEMMKPKIVLHFGTQLGINVWDNAIKCKIRAKIL